MGVFSSEVYHLQVHQITRFLIKKNLFWRGGIIITTSPKQGLGDVHHRKHDWCTNWSKKSVGRKKRTKLEHHLKFSLIKIQHFLY